MKNVLVVYDLIPDKKELYLVKNVSEEMLETIKDCHGRFINSTNSNNSCEKLMVWIEDPKNFDQELLDITGLPKEDFGKLRNSFIEHENVIDAKDIDLIVLTGYFL